MNNFDDLKLATEAMTGGKNTVLLDDVGMPSIMVVIPKMSCKDLITGAADTTHPAFIVNNIEKDKVYISKYINVVHNNRAYSLPMQDPHNNVNFNNALAYCNNKGNGWGLMPASLWAAIALWCKKNGTMPHGNNNYGADISYPHEKGVATSAGSDGKINRTATGSGPASWNHDNTIAGICDLNGNVWEWQSGIRLVYGELQILANANAIDPSYSQDATSTWWKAIHAQTGKLVAPESTITSQQLVGTTVKLNYSSTGNVWSFESGIESEQAIDSSRSCAFAKIKSDQLGDGAKILLRSLALIPDESTTETDYEGDLFYANNGTAERCVFRGGYWAHGANAGVFSLHGIHSRSSVITHIGFRSAYYDL